MKKENITIDIAGRFDEHDAKSVIALLKQNGVKANMNLERPDIVEDEFQDYNATLEDIETLANGYWGQAETPREVKSDLRGMEKQVMKFRALVEKLAGCREKVEVAFGEYQAAQKKK